MADFNGHDAASATLRAAGADAMIGGDAAAVLHVVQAIEAFKSAAMLAAASIGPSSGDGMRQAQQPPRQVSSPPPVATQAAQGGATAAATLQRPTSPPAIGQRQQQQQQQQQQNQGTPVHVAR